MAYSALTLITRAYYLSQIISRELQTPTGAQIEDGLFLLNSLLDFKNSDLRLIPYFNQYSFLPSAGAVVDGTWVVDIPNLLFIDTMTFNIGPVRYPMIDMSRKEFFATPRVDNIQTLPFSYRPERTLEGMDVYLYFTPAGIDSFRIWGKFGLTSVVLNTDMSTIYDLYYIEYLRYELAEYLCSEWAVSFPELAQRKLDELRKKIMDVSPPDLTRRKISYFGHGWGLDWQTCNLYKGWLPSN